MTWTPVDARAAAAVAVGAGVAVHAGASMAHLDVTRMVVMRRLLLLRVPHLVNLRTRAEGSRAVVKMKRHGSGHSNWCQCWRNFLSPPHSHSDK